MNDVREQRAAADRERRTCAPAFGRSRRSAAAATRTRTSSSRSTDPISRRSSATPNAVADAAKKEPGVVDVDTSLNVGKPELSVESRSDEGRGSRRPGLRRGRGAAAARRRGSGDDVQRRRRAVRGARARGRGQTGRSAEAIGQMTVPSSAAGQRAARQHRAVHPRHGAVRDQPAQSSAAGDGVRRACSRACRRRPRWPR